MAGLFQGLRIVLGSGLGTERHPFFLGGQNLLLTLGKLGSPLLAALHLLREPGVLLTQLTATLDQLAFQLLEVAITLVQLGIGHLGGKGAG